MLTLYKSLVMSRLEYASQLWSPYLLKHVYLPLTLSLALSLIVGEELVLYVILVRVDLAP